MESDLLSHAFSKMSMFNSSGLRSLERLREDRHTSAHPAFVSSDQLYEPSNEQTRAHLIAAIDIVLGQSPVRGRGIIDAFGTDLVSPGFPTNYDASLNYIEQKYLAHMRPVTVANFGTVLAKSAIWENVEGWVPHIQRIIFALMAIQQRRPLDWAHVEADLVRLINDDNPKFRSNSLMMIGWFPDLVARIAPTIADALTEHSRNPAGLLEKPRAFLAVGVPRFEQDVLASFLSLNDEQKAAVVSVAPMPSFWPSALVAFSQARSYRGAEYLFDALIGPFIPRLMPDGLTAVFRAAATNAQIWSAGGIPNRLATMLDITQRLPSWEAADELYRATYNGTAIDPIVFERLTMAGWPRPTPPPPPPPPPPPAPAMPPEPPLK